jgi:PAS domain S-box-containing protein
LESDEATATDMPGALQKLKFEVEDRKQVEDKWRESQEKLRSIVEHSNEVFFVHNLDHEITYMSSASKEIFGYTPEEMMRKWTELITDNPINEKGFEITEKAMATGQRQAPYLLEARKKEGTLIMLEINESPIKDSQGNVLGITGALRDVTNQIRAEQALKKAHDRLEQRVNERTQELSIANEKMLQEIRERKLAEKSLRAKEKKVRLQANRLEEMNTALKVLIDHRDEEERGVKENILMNVNRLVMPYLDKLDMSIPNGHAKTYLDIVKTNLKELVSPFASNLSLKHLNLTPTEMQVADLIRHGHTSKEISLNLNVSIDAVNFHRKSIRKKLGLTNKKSNLKSYLQRLSE